MNNKVKTHREALERLAAIGNELSEISQAIGINISCVARTDGFINATVGDYEYIRVPGYEPHYEYRPILTARLWKRTSLDQITSLTEPPIKKAPRSGSSEGAEKIK